MAFEALPGRTERISRRDAMCRFALAGLSLGGGVLLGVTGCSDASGGCVDAELLSTPERSLRKTQRYVDRSPHGAEQQCGGCQFFSATDQTTDQTTVTSACGTCRILGGPVSATGHCAAWARARAA
jgi:hypothetical protein